MTYISKHFTHDEVRCKCGCRFDQVNINTLDVADAIRDYVNKPVNCSSACRCVDHNAKIGGAVQSRHLPRAYKIGSLTVFQSDGMDLHLDDPADVAHWLDANYPLVSYIIYSWGLHVDTRPKTYKKR